MIGEVKLLASLGAAAALLFAYQWKLHQAREEGRQECRDAAIAEYRENADELSRISTRARTVTARLSADAGNTRAAADRLRGAVAGSGLVIRSAAARGSEAMSETERLSGQLFESCQAITEWAECLANSGEACRQSYEALRK